MYSSEVNGKFSYPCEFCGKVYRTKLGLKIHYVIGNRADTCSMDQDKSLRKSSDLYYKARDHLNNEKKRNLDRLYKALDECRKSIEKNGRTNRGDEKTAFKKIITEIK